MRRLALEGGIPLIRQPIRPLNTVSTAQVGAVNAFMSACRDGKATLSGYLAGSERGGSAVQRLEDVIAREFGVRHAVAMNSGTTAILAACVAVGVKKDTTVIVPAMGMSAAAAMPTLLGARVIFVDIDSHFCIDSPPIQAEVIIAVNLFGHPAKLYDLRRWADERGCWLIEDNAQAPWATENDCYTGCIGHIGTFSFNCHKPTNAGEGGIAVTNDDQLARRMRAFINHAECSDAHLD